MCWRVNNQPRLGTRRGSSSRLAFRCLLLGLVLLALRIHLLVACNCFLQMIFLYSRLFQFNLYISFSVILVGTKILLYVFYGLFKYLFVIVIGITTIEIICNLSKRANLNFPILNQGQSKKH